MAKKATSLKAALEDAADETREHLAALLKGAAATDDARAQAAAVVELGRIADRLGAAAKRIVAKSKK